MSADSSCGPLTLLITTAYRTNKPCSSCWPTEQNPHITSNYVIHLHPSHPTTNNLPVLHFTQVSLPSDVLIPQPLLRNTNNGAVTATAPPSKEPKCAVCHLDTQWSRQISSKWANWRTRSNVMYSTYMTAAAK